MRFVSFSLAAVAAITSSAALAEYTPEQQDEMLCVYNQLTTDQRVQVVDMLFAIDEASAIAAEQALNPVFDAATAACVTRHGWSDEGVAAGEEFAIAAIAYEAMQATLPETIDPEKLNQLIAGFEPEFSYTFTYEAQEMLDEAAFEAWKTKAEKSVGDAGIAEADRGYAIVYLSALADFSLARAKWSNLFEQQPR